MACRVISRAWEEAVVVTRWARAQAPSPPPQPTGTHQEHGLLMDESLLQSERGGIQAWDWQSQVRGRGSQGVTEGGKQAFLI